MTELKKLKPKEIKMLSLFKFLLSYFPTALPIGRAAFEKWTAEVIALAGVPDNRSTRFAVSMMVLHGHEGKSRISKRVFANKLYKAAANEVAVAVAEELKAAQKSEDEAAKLKVVSSGQEVTSGS